MKRPSDYSQRFYRKWQRPDDLTPFRVQQGETDLQIYAESDLSETAQSLTAQYRRQLEETIAHHPEFLSSLKPLHLESPYRMIQDMIRESGHARVGPMAGVAGAMAAYVGGGLLASSDEIIIENGGDIFIKTKRERVLHVYVREESCFKDKLLLKLKVRENPYGICTSSAYIGHSLSLGRSDATLIIAHSAIAADVFATAVGNMVKQRSDIDRGLAAARDSGRCLGALIVMGDRIGVWGEIELAT